MPLFISQKKLELEIAKRVSETCDQILSEMGAELHDDLIQKLSIFRLYIDRIERASDDKVEIQTLALKMRSDFEQVVRVIKNISRRLLPLSMDTDSLKDMVEVLCQTMGQPGTGHVHFENNGNPESLSNNIKIHLVRITQELIQNAFKHSAAWNVWVRLNLENENIIILEVEDDGSGFSKISEFVKKLKTKNNTLKLRVQAIGASIDYLQGSQGLLAKVKLKVQQ